MSHKNSQTLLAGTKSFKSKKNLSCGKKNPPFILYIQKFLSAEA